MGRSRSTGSRVLRGQGCTALLLLWWVARTRGRIRPWSHPGPSLPEDPSLSFPFLPFPSLSPSHLHLQQLVLTPPQIHPGPSASPAPRAHPHHTDIPGGSWGLGAQLLPCIEPRSAASFTRLPEPPWLHRAPPDHCTPILAAPPARCIPGQAQQRGGQQGRAPGRAGARGAAGKLPCQLSARARQTQPAQGCLFWLGATWGWHYIKPGGAWQVLAGGDRGAAGASRGSAPSQPPPAPRGRGRTQGPVPPPG